jgi:exosortase/archaeosortase family protein
MNKAKSTFSTLFLVLVVLLMFLPFITTFNEFLTRVFLRLEWYRVIENFVVPFEVRSIVAVLRLFGMEVSGSNTTISVTVNGALQTMWISWNCIGWQSAILLVFTLFTGLQGSYKISSKVETIIIGILGTFVMNIFRMSLVVIIFKYFGHLPALIFHDYFANVAIIAWLFFYWWFCYRFVLEEEARSE